VSRGDFFRPDPEGRVSIVPVLQDHADGSFGTDQCAYTASLAIIKVNQHLSCFFIPSDAEVRAEEAAHFTCFAFPCTETAPSLSDRLFLEKARFSRRESTPWLFERKGFLPDGPFSLAFSCIQNPRVRWSDRSRLTSPYLSNTTAL